VSGSQDVWHGTTQDWAGALDDEHLASIRQDAATYAPGGDLHLVPEVVAYPADEAEWNGSGRCEIAVNGDGSVSVTDYGRGTDIRFDDEGRPVKKPVMSTKDLRFFGSPDAPLLPDGHPRRGMSVVAALSEWLVHTNRRDNGSWTQRYKHGIPVTDLVPIEGNGTTGTTVWFRPDRTLRLAELATTELIRLVAAWPHLPVKVSDARCSG
jgi:topoisomerase IV subunit B